MPDRTLGLGASHADDYFWIEDEVQCCVAYPDCLHKPCFRRNVRDDEEYDETTPD